MEPLLKQILKGLSLEIRHALEGEPDQQGKWVPGDLERRLNELGVWRDRPSKPIEEMPQLSDADRRARRLVESYTSVRQDAGVHREAAVEELVRECAYNWANRLFDLLCPRLEEIAGIEALDLWASRDGTANPPNDNEGFHRQEPRYDPDLNDGVRVNIAPLQRAGLLAAEVILRKDVEKAIAGRAEWRADERRWDREGKLLRRGWWKEAKDQGEE